MTNFDHGGHAGRALNCRCRKGLDSDAATRRDRMCERVKIRFRLLGPRLTGRFAVSMGKRAASPFKISPQKGRTLLAYLAMQPEHFARREDLANLLWGDRVDKYARHNLRQCLAILRDELASIAPDFLILRRDAVALRGQSLAVDALEFVALAQSGELSQLDRALELYRGEFLAGNALDVEPFSRWVMAERSRLHAIGVGLFEQCAKQSDALGNGDQAIKAAERLISLEPLREDWHRLFLRICARHRSPEAADTHAKWLCELLKRELDVAPEHETVALIEDIRGRRIGIERQSAIHRHPVDGKLTIS
jgi:DNA-binding SARP family transcriptional activator